MSCLQINPWPVCGVDGQCSDINQTNVCLCVDADWEQSLEFGRYFVDDDGDISEGLCIYRPTLVQALYWILLAFATFDIIILLGIFCNGIKIRHSERGHLLVSILLVSLCFYRIINPAEALFGFDFAFTFLVVHVVMFGQLLFFEFFHRYLREESEAVRMKTVPTLGEVYTSCFSFTLNEAKARTVHICLTIISVVLLEILLTTVWMENRASLVIFRLVVVSQGIFRLYELYYVHIALHHFHETIQSVENERGRAYVLQLHEEYRHIRNMRKTILVVRTPELFFCFLVLLDFW